MPVEQTAEINNEEPPNEVVVEAPKEEEKKFDRTQLALIDKKARAEEREKADVRIAELQAKIDSMTQAQTPVSPQSQPPVQQQEPMHNQNIAQQQQQQTTTPVSEPQLYASPEQQQEAARIGYLHTKYNKSLEEAMRSDPEFAKDLESMHTMIPQDVHNMLAESDAQDSPKILNYLIKNPELLICDPNSAIAAAKVGVSTIKPSSEAFVHGDVAGEGDEEHESAYDALMKNQRR